MTDEPIDDTPEELDELIAEAAADVAAEAGDDVAADEVAAQMPEELDAELADSTTDEEPVDWESLASLDDRTKGQLLADLTEASVARDGFLDSLQRKQAEFDNFRKRTQRDAAAMRISGHVEVASRLLDVLDDFDRVIDNAGKFRDDRRGLTEVDEVFLKGVTLVHDKLIAGFADFGLSRIDEVNVDFDPNRHEAVQQHTSEEPIDEPQVIEVYRAGYEMAGRVLRAAMVVVKTEPNPW